MAVTNRSPDLRQLAADLAEQYGLPGGAEGLTASYDEPTRAWTFRWQDGPTVEQVRRAARTAQPEVVKGLGYERLLPLTAPRDAPGRDGSSR